MSPGPSTGSNGAVAMPCALRKVFSVYRSCDTVSEAARGRTGVPAASTVSIVSAGTFSNSSVTASQAVANSVSASISSQAADQAPAATRPAGGSSSGE